MSSLRLAIIHDLYSTFVQIPPPWYFILREKTAKTIKTRRIDAEPAAASTVRWNIWAFYMRAELNVNRENERAAQDGWTRMESEVYKLQTNSSNSPAEPLRYGRRHEPSGRNNWREDKKRWIETLGCKINKTPWFLATLVICRWKARRVDSIN